MAHRCARLMMAFALVMAACAPSTASGPVDRSESLATTVPAVSAETSQAVGSTSSPAASEPESRSATIPVTSDPCTEAAEHQVGEDEYVFDFDGEDRPVTVHLSSKSALEEPTVVIGLHAEARSRNDMSLLLRAVGLHDILELRGGYILFAAQAAAGTEAFWSQSESFNVDYLETLFANLERSVCLDEAEIVLFAFGQGGLVAAEAICRTSLPIDLVVMMIGLVKLQECDPGRPVPILSYDHYDYHPLLGAHWDGSWNPPNPREVELTGGIDATPDDLAVWAAVYGCTDPVAEEYIEADGVDRATTILTYRDCGAPLVAFGLEAVSDDIDTNPRALASIQDRLEAEVDRLLADR